MMVGRARQKLELERLVDKDAVQATTVQVVDFQEPQPGHVTMRHISSSLGVLMSFTPSSFVAK
jgi:hypothetical protein